jgi:hypothetical protein
MCIEMLDSVFSPLGKEYCIIYYVLMVLVFVQLVIIVIDVVMMLTTGKKVSSKEMMYSGLAIVNVATTYILSRLQYSICEKAL